MNKVTKWIKQWIKSQFNPLLSIARHNIIIVDAVPKFWFQLMKGSSKNVLWMSQGWVGRRKEPILGYVPKTQLSSCNF